MIEVERTAGLMTHESAEAHTRTRSHNRAVIVRKVLRKSALYLRVERLDEKRNVIQKCCQTSEYRRFDRSWNPLANDSNERSSNLSDKRFDSLGCGLQNKIRDTVC